MLFFSLDLSVGCLELSPGCLELFSGCLDLSDIIILAASEAKFADDRVLETLA